MTTNTPNDQTNNQNLNNDLPWQAKPSNQMDPVAINSTVNDTMPSNPTSLNVEPVTAPEISNPIEAGINETVNPIQEQPVVMPEFSKPVDSFQTMETMSEIPQAQSMPEMPSMPEVQPVQTMPEIPNRPEVEPIQTMPEAQPMPTMPENQPMPELPKLPEIQPNIEPQATNVMDAEQIPQAQTNNESGVIEKTESLPEIPNTTQPVIVEEKSSEIENSSRVKNILLVIGVMIAGVAALILGIYIASNAA
jgi:hypothetical protein